MLQAIVTRYLNYKNIKEWQLIKINSHYYGMVVTKRQIKEKLICNNLLDAIYTVLAAIFLKTQ